jgi:FkbM family methyltransferase
MRRVLRELVGESFFARARALYWSIKLRFVRYEPETRILPQLISPGDCCLDVGANFGQFASYLGRTVGDEGRVFSFEPLPYNQEIFRRVMRLLRRDNVELIPAAVADREGNLTISVPENNTAEAFVSAGEGLSVKAITIDGFVTTRNLERVHLLKIDVEGFEFEVVRGGLQTIRRDRPPIICEVTEHAAGRRGVDPLATFRILEEEGYRPYVVEGDDIIAVTGMVDRINYVFLWGPGET